MASVISLLPINDTNNSHNNLKLNNNSVYGGDLVIQGTGKQINKMLEKLYYISSENVRGDVILNIAVSDSYNNCDNNNNNNCYIGNETLATTDIHLYVIPVNQPPVITLQQNRISILKDTPVTISYISIYDTDHIDKDSKLTTKEINITAPISLYLQVNIGYITFPIRDGLAFLEIGHSTLNIDIDNKDILKGQGRGNLGSRHLYIRGSIDDMNNALLNMRYICPSSSSSTSSLTDNQSIKDIINITVDDEGFYGSGGSKITEKQFEIYFM
jgi:hypothetical protein